MGKTPVDTAMTRIYHRVPQDSNALLPQPTGLQQHSKLYGALFSLKENFFASTKNIFQTSVKAAQGSNYVFNEKQKNRTPSINKIIAVPYHEPSNQNYALNRLEEMGLRKNLKITGLCLGQVVIWMNPVYHSSEQKPTDRITDLNSETASLYATQIQNQYEKSVYAYYKQAMSAAKKAEASLDNPLTIEEATTNISPVVKKYKLKNETITDFHIRSEKILTEGKEIALKEAILCYGITLNDNPIVIHFPPEQSYPERIRLLQEMMENIKKSPGFYFFSIDGKEADQTDSKHAMGMKWEAESNTFCFFDPDTGEEGGMDEKQFINRLDAVFFPLKPDISSMKVTQFTIARASYKKEPNTILLSKNSKPQQNSWKNSQRFVQLHLQNNLSSMIKFSSAIENIQKNSILCLELGLHHFPSNLLKNNLEKLEIDGKSLLTYLKKVPAPKDTSDTNTEMQVKINAWRKNFEHEHRQMVPISNNIIKNSESMIQLHLQKIEKLSKDILDSKRGIENSIHTINSSGNNTNTANIHHELITALNHNIIFNETIIKSTAYNIEQYKKIIKNQKNFLF